VCPPTAFQPDKDLSGPRLDDQGVSGAAELGGPKAIGAGGDEVAVAPTGHEILADVERCRPGEAALLIASVQIPDPSRIVGAGPLSSSGLREEAPVVLAKGHTTDTAGMPAEHNRAARDGVPDLDLTVYAARENAPAVGVEGQGVHVTDMTME